MRDRDRDGDWLLWFWVLACVVIILVGVLISFWRASIQAGVYRRQGVEMSVWEVWMGAKPVERMIVAPPEKP